jgi:thiol-disulfide isomerase/thioredoxin
MNILKSLALVLVFLLLRVEAYGAKVELITANDLTAILKRQDEHKKILLFFTSWCPYCKSAIQQIIDDKAQDKVTFISLDKDYSQIAAFAPSIPDGITIYYMATQTEIVSFFNTYGIRYKGSIPYISILDEDNDLLQDDLSPRQLQKYLR